MDDLFKTIHNLSPATKLSFINHVLCGLNGSLIYDGIMTHRHQQLKLPPPQTKFMNTGFKVGIGGYGLILVAKFLYHN